MVAKLKVTVEGLNALSKRLKPDTLWRVPILDLVGEMRREADRLADQRVPRGATGKLAGAISSSMSGTATSPMAIIKQGNVTSRSHGAKRAFRYGPALDVSKKPAFRYRGGKAGRPTLGWWKKIPSLVNRILRARIKKAERAIEANFGRGSVGGGA